MSKIKCRHCGKEFNDTRGICPICGTTPPPPISEKIKAIAIQTLKVLGLVVLVFSILIFLLIYSQRLPPSTSKQTTYRVTPYELYSDFVKNEIAAEEKYKKGRIEVSGPVKSLGRSAGELFVSVGLTGKVHCSFKNEYAADLAKINKWDEVTIRGEYDEFLFSVYLDNCHLVEHIPNPH